MKNKKLTIIPTIVLRPKNCYNNITSLMIVISPKVSNKMKNRLMVILILKWCHTSMTILRKTLKTKREKRITIICQ